ncbi:type II secretion system GspH family protein [Polaribacter sp.]|nr:type II secretion system GspH family protein [Polaribacter sp.]
MKQNKIRAFTLGELLVVMIVSSIVISMTFLVLNMTRRQINTIQENYQKKEIFRFFETTLLRDFNSHTAYYDLKAKRLSLTNTKDNIRYTFLDRMILRDQDTFQIEVVKINLFLDGKIVLGKSIDAISMEASKSFAQQQLFVQQRKDAAYYINN